MNEKEYVYFPWGRYTRIGNKFYKGVTSIIHVLPMSHGLKRWIFSKGFDEANEHMNNRAKIGTTVHGALERYARGKIDDCKEGEITLDECIDLVDGVEKKRMINNYFRWISNLEKEGKKIEFKKTEYSVYSNVYKYGGTSDIFCLIDNERWIIDYKTAALFSYDDFKYDEKTKSFEYQKKNFYKFNNDEKMVKKEYALQLAAYKNAIVEMSNGLYDKNSIRCGILNLRDDCYVFEEMNIGNQYDIDFRYFLSCLNIFKWSILNQYNVEDILKQCGLDKYYNEII